VRIVTVWFSGKLHKDVTPFKRSQVFSARCLYTLRSRSARRTAARRWAYLRRNPLNRIHP